MNFKEEVISSSPFFDVIAGVFVFCEDRNVRLRMELHGHIQFVEISNLVERWCVRSEIKMSPRSSEHGVE